MCVYMGSHIECSPTCNAATCYIEGTLFCALGCCALCGLSLSDSLCAERYLSTFIPHLEETTPLRVLLMESSSQVKIGFVRIMFDVMGSWFIGLYFCYPRPQISMLGICCGTCELDSITRTLTYVRQTTLYPTLSFGGTGGHCKQFTNIL